MISTLVCVSLLATALAPQGATQQSNPPRAGEAGVPASFTWGDYDGDGLEDALVITPAGDVRLSRNLGDGTLADVTSEVGLGEIVLPSFALWGDYDRDGNDDLFVGTRNGRSHLFHNFGNGTFEEVSQVAGITHAGDVLHASWFDYDQDGRPDLHVRTEAQSLLYRNLGQGRFEVVDLGASTARVPTGPEPRLAVAPEEAPENANGKAAEAPPRGPAATGGVELAVPPGTVAEAIPGPFCAKQIKNQSGGPCLLADSTPTFGRLYPLGPELNIDPAGNVGIGTVSPAEKLDVAGGVRGAQFVSTTPGPPFVVSSPSKVNLLNADFLDGQDSLDFTQLGNSIEGFEITNGTIGAEDLTNPLAGSGSPVPVVQVEATGSGNALVAKSTGSGWGVVGESVGGIGVHGQVTASTGLALGVVGQSHSDSGIGMLGQSTSSSGGTGVEGTASSSIGVGVLGYNFATTGPAYAVQGSTSSRDGVGVYGEARDQSGGGTIGVYGKVLSVDGVGVEGEGGAYGVQGTGNSIGVRGENAASHGSGVYGVNTNSTVGYGVSGTAYGDGVSADDPSAGVLGSTFSNGTYTCGVYGETGSDTGYGVFARARSLSGLSKGVYAQADSISGDAVHGVATATSGSAWGVRGETASPTGYGVYCSGDFTATGTKSFTQPHPTDPSKEIQFACLEGNESGTYFRGSSRFVGGVAVIEVPEEFRLVSEAEGLTVMSQPLGGPALIWTESKSLDRIVLRSNLDVPFDYFVNGVRRGFAQHRAIRPNESFVPSVRGVPYGTQYPPELRRVLIENGTLNPDYTPNEDTAGRQGWSLRDASAAFSGPSSQVPYQVPAGT